MDVFFSWMECCGHDSTPVFLLRFRQIEMNANVDCLGINKNKLSSPHLFLRQRLPRHAYRIQRVMLLNSKVVFDIRIWEVG
jgi:hypothetical protein